MSPACYDAFVSVGMLEHVGLGGYEHARRGHRSVAHGQRPRAAALHRPGSSAAAECVDSQADLSRRVSAHPPRSLRARARAAGPLDPRCREPPAPLCGDAGALAPAVQRRVGPNRGDVRRAVRACLAAVPGWLAGRIHDRLLCSCSRSCSAGRRATASRGRASGVEGSTEMERCDVLIAGGGPAGSSCAWRLRRSGLDVLVVDRATFPRDKVCAGWITPQVISELEIDVAAYRRGRTFQPITAFLTGIIGGRTAHHHVLRPRRQLRHQAMRVRSLPPRALRRPAEARHLDRKPAAIRRSVDRQ